MSLDRAVAKSLDEMWERAAREAGGTFDELRDAMGVVPDDEPAPIHWRAS